MIDPYHEQIIQHGTSYHDARGVIDNILSGVEIVHIARISSRKGSVRGNHYHPSQDQYILVISGGLKSVSGPVSEDGSIGMTVEVLAGPGTLLHCPPNVAHAYYFLEDTWFLNMDTGSRGEPGEDTIPCTVLREEDIDA